jgi:hypothetical protein
MKIQWKHTIVKDGLPVTCYFDAGDVIHEEDHMICRTCKNSMELTDIKDPMAEDIENPFTDDIYPVGLLQ